VNVFFDVDYTILSVDGSLRPGTRDVFRRLVADGHKVFVWSGVGLRTAEVRRHSLEEYVAGVFHKPLENFESGLWAFGVTARPDFVIDDYPEIVSFFGGVVVTPYYFSRADDAEMERVYRIVADYALNGRSEDVAFRPKRARPHQDS
jgi:hypothetical protein